MGHLRYEFGLLLKALRGRSKPPLSLKTTISPIYSLEHQVQTKYLASGNLHFLNESYSFIYSGEGSW